MIIIDVISDTVCPWCYIGKKQLDSALDQRKNIEFSVTYKPFQLDPTMPLEGVDRKKYIERKFGKKTAKEAGLRISQAGDEVGIKFNYDKIDITPNTFNSHRLIRWSLPYNKQSELLDFLFIAYFEEGKNIGDTDILLQISEELNLNKNDIKESFLNDIDRKEVEAEEWSFRDLGIAGVPTYIINKEIIITGAQSSDNFVKLFDKIAS